MKALVTGGAGFIGSHVVEALLTAGHQVVVVDDLSRGRRKQVPPGAALEICDMGAPRLAALMADHRPDAVLHLAAQVDVRRSVAEPRHDAAVNVLGTLNLLQAAQAAGVKTLVFSSTGGAIYGDQEAYPAKEEHPCRPLSPYGVSKLCAEAYATYFGGAHGMRTVILRYSNVYGPRQDPHGEAGVVAIFADRLLAQQPALIYGDGQQTRDFVYVGDVARANLLALESSLSGVFNIGTGVETPIVALYEALARLAGSRSQPRHQPARLGEQRRSAIDATRAVEMLRWRPEISLNQGLARTLAAFAARAQFSRP